MSQPTIFQQASAVLNSIYQQETGRSLLTATEPNFISVANTVLSLGKDKVYNALMGVIGRTIFSIRPYSAKLKGLEFSLEKWGEYDRKISIVDSEMHDNQAYKYPVTYDGTENPATGDGLSVDPWIIKKREFLETFFVGSSVFQDHYSIMEKQLINAFQSPEQLMQFISLHTTDESNKIEQYKEGISHAVLCNLIATLVAENDSTRVVKLLTLYNSELGLTGNDAYTATTINRPDAYKAFRQWAFAKIASISKKMEERSVMYQTNITGKPIPRHTPYGDQKMYVLADDDFAMTARVLTDTFHQNFINNADYEIVTYWQAMQTPSAINLKPTYTGTNGQPVTAQSAVTKDHVFAVLFDRQACGWRMIDHTTDLTPKNPNGQYRNVWHNMLIKSVQDNTEKAVVFLME